MNPEYRDREANARWLGVHRWSLTYTCWKASLSLNQISLIEPYETMNVVGSARLEDLMATSDSARQEFDKC